MLQTSLVIPEAEGYMVYSSTQWTQRTQAAVAAVLGINNSRSASLCHKCVLGVYMAIRIVVQ